jgi:large subunit GTPase 1
MLFRCEDLERYVVETSQEKINLILINKADFLSEKQRQHWAEYFDNVNLPVAFFSALEENQNNQLRKLKLLEEEEEEEEDVCEEVDEDDSEYEDVEESEEHDEEESRIVEKESVPEIKVTEDVAEPSADQTTKDVSETLQEKNPNASLVGVKIKNSTRLLTGIELIELFKTIHQGRKVQEGRSVIGLVGYPNVGKSSTINSLLTFKKVSVSATPGKTKHFQVQIRFIFSFANNNFLHLFSVYRP